jgi:methionyl-tRNA synthetase
VSTRVSCLVMFGLLQRIFAHGWWTRDGEKMSKSVGNVLDPFTLVQHYGVDYVRYFMAAEFPFGNDGDFSHEAFCTRINVDLANDLGNLAQRTLTMVDRHLGGVVPAAEGFSAEDQEVLKALRDNLPQVRELLNQQSVKSICDSVIALARLGNRYIQSQAPWELVKTNPDRLRTVVYVLMELLRHSAIVLQPVVPQSSVRMLDMLGVPADPMQRNFDALTRYSSVGNKIAPPSPLFPKIQPPPVEALVTTSGVVNTEVGAPEFSQYDEFDGELLAERIAQVSEEIRARKAQKASKGDLAPLIKELLYLKNR